MAARILLMNFLVVVFLPSLCLAQAGQDTEKTWLFAVGGNRRPGNFINERGVLAGFDVDLIRGVCQKAMKKCAITVQPYTECVRTVNDRFFPGIGIMGGFYDACTGLTISRDRLNSMEFTEAYKATISTFTVRVGNPTNLTLATLSNAVIGHLEGAATNVQCLTRLGYTVKKAFAIPSIIDAKAALANGTVDALFSPRASIPPFETLPFNLKCDEGGVGMMVKPGSDLPSWWNSAFQQYVADGSYFQLCQSAFINYGKNVTNCFDFSSKNGIKYDSSISSTKSGAFFNTIIASVIAYFR